jgi:hypothetical protein
MMPPALEDFMQWPARAPSQLSESLHKRLNAYALAASAAGVGVLASVQPAEARIVYTKVDYVIGQHYNLDLTNDGVADFTFFTQTRTGRTSIQFETLNVSAQGQNAFFRNASPQGSGVRIGPKGKFEQTYQVMVEAKGFCSRTTQGGSCRSYCVEGKWCSVGRGYLGLKFFIHGKAHYGWARLSVRLLGHLQGIQAVLTGYAYESTPGKAIITGKTKGPDVITVQPATLGHLAVGASAIPVWRTDQ